LKTQEHFTKKSLTIANFAINKNSNFREASFNYLFDNFGFELKFQKK